MLERFKSSLSQLVSILTVLTKLSERYAPYCAAILSAVVYVVSYLDYPSVPGNNPTSLQGWMVWFDQSKFISSATALANFNFASKEHWYPLGYPLLGSVFAKILPQHTFLVPNLLSVGVSAYLLVLIFRRYVSSLEALIVLILFFLFTPKHILCMSLIIPWNTIPLTLLIYMSIYLSQLQPSRRNIYLGSLLVGLAFFLRPFDAALMLSLLVIMVFNIQRKTAFRAAVVGATIVFVFVAAYFGLNYWIYGNIYSSYELLSKRQGFFGFGIEQVYTLLFDSRQLFTYDYALFSWMPWLYAALPGLVLLFKRQHVSGLYILILIVLSCLGYFKYNLMWPHSVMAFGSIHYLFWMLPILALCSYMSLVYAWRELNPLLFTVLAVSLLSIYSFVSIEVASTLSWTFKQSRNNGLVYIIEEKSGSNEKYQYIVLKGIIDTHSYAEITAVENGERKELAVFKDYFVYLSPEGLTIYFAKPQTSHHIEIKFNSKLSSYKDDLAPASFDFVWRLYPRFAAANRVGDKK